jgi:hypothetical protein
MAIQIRGENVQALFSAGIDYAVKTEPEFVESGMGILATVGPATRSALIGLCGGIDMHRSVFWMYIMRLGQVLLGSGETASNLPRYFDQVWKLIPDSVLKALLPCSIGLGVAVGVIQGIIEVEALARQIRIYNSPVVRAMRILENLKNIPEGQERVAPLKALAKELYAMSGKISRIDDAGELAGLCLKLAGECNGIANCGGVAPRGKPFEGLCKEAIVLVVEVYQGTLYGGEGREQKVHEYGKGFGLACRQAGMKDGKISHNLLSYKHRQINGRERGSPDEVDRIFININKAVLKKMATHVVGLIAIICTIAAAAFTLIGGGWMVILGLCAAGFIFSSARTIIQAMTLNEKTGTWQWSFTALVPGAMITLTKKVYNWVKNLTAAEDDPLKRNMWEVPSGRLT